MSKFLQYLAEAEYAAENPIPGDQFDLEFGFDELVIETVVSEIDDDGNIVLEADETMLALLEQHGALLEDSNAGVLSPPNDSISPIHGASFLPYDKKKDPRKWMTDEGKPDEEKEHAKTPASSPVTEAEYQGRKVPLGKPMKGDVKKSKVYVKKPNGKVVKVNFGDKTMRIKKSNPKRKKSFRARHNCANPGPRWKARYWSCRAW
jgi:hypothetical protein